MSDVLIDILNIVADGYDAVRPGAGDCVREEIERREAEALLASPEADEERA